MIPLDRCPNQAIDYLGKQLAPFQERQFTGRLDVSVGDQTWYLYLALGRFAWATGGCHPTRRWRRQMIRSGLFASASKIRLRQSDRFECWDYQVLTLLAQRKQATTEQVIAVIRGIVAEVLFEIVQLAGLTSQAEPLATSADCLAADPEACLTLAEPLACAIIPRLGMRPSTTDTGILPRAWTVEIAPALKLTQDIWQHWAAAGLARCSPNLAPILRQPQLLQQKTSPKVYQTLCEAINGKRSLRDLAVLLKKDLLGLTRSLLPYLRQQSISLVEIPDLPLPAFARTPDTDSEAAPPPQTAAVRTSQRDRRHLIVCIDDNPQICQVMAELLEEAGYQLVAVQEAVQALPTLLKHKPDLIFLDLVMPIASGYEICTQIRRVSAFTATPVIILTGNDGIVDRIRAKMVGATDFLSKPIDAVKVTAIAHRYIQDAAAQSPH